MILQKTTQTLREQLRQWAATPEWPLLVRYELLPQKPSSVWHKRLSQKLGRCLRVLGLSRSRYRKQTWRVDLKHAPVLPNSATLLVWSDIDEATTQRSACKSLQQLLEAHPNLCPALVTKVADFAFYSRLGWLVEYLPDISGESPGYRERKQRYLAWRYRDAIAVPLSAGLASTEEFNLLLKTGK